MLLNHISPKHVDFALKHSKAEFNAPYGPCLVLPSEYEQDLILATAMIMRSSKTFLEEMGYIGALHSIESIDVLSLIHERQKGRDLRTVDEFRELEKFREFLLENFSISGGVGEITAKIEILLEKCQHVILSDPFFRDEKFDVHLRKILENLKKKI